VKGGIFATAFLLVTQVIGYWLKGRESVPGRRWDYSLPITTSASESHPTKYAIKICDFFNVKKLTTYQLVVRF
jgi:hypothetical protein